MYTIRRCLPLMALVIYFTACSTQPPRNSGEPVSSRTLPQGTPDVSSLTPLATATGVETASETVVSSPAATPEPSFTPTPTAPSPTPIIAPGVVLRTECPTVINSDSPLWSDGSILFSKGTIWSDAQPHDIAEQPGVWAVSVNGEMPGLVFESTAGGWISPDGSLFMSTKRDTENLTLEVVFYNLTNDEEYRLMIPYDFRFQGWLPDGRARFVSGVERVLGAGETLEILTIDAIRQTSESVTKELELPGFAFDDSEVERFGLFYGYDALDPTGQLILYSVQNDGVNDFEIRLLNLQTGEVIWRQDTLYLSSSSPQWSIDGSRVLFDVSVPITDTRNSWSKIISLSRNGQVEELPPQPFPFTSEGELNGYSHSPSGRYILYIAVETNVQTFTAKNRAFIVDTLTWEVKEVCLPEATFVAPIPAGINREGYWLPGDQFVYRLMAEREGQLTHSLYILDIPTWETQLVFESEPGYGVNILGWTPVEFPRS